MGCVNLIKRLVFWAVLALGVGFALLYSASNPPSFPQVPPVVAPVAPAVPEQRATFQYSRVHAQTAPEVGLGLIRAGNALVYVWDDQSNLEETVKFVGALPTLPVSDTIEVLKMLRRLSTSPDPGSRGEWSNWCKRLDSSVLKQATPAELKALAAAMEPEPGQDVYTTLALLCDRQLRAEAGTPGLAYAREALGWEISEIKSGRKPSEENRSFGDSWSLSYRLHLTPLNDLLTLMHGQAFPGAILYSRESRKLQLNDACGAIREAEKQAAALKEAAQAELTRRG